MAADGVITAVVVDEDGELRSVTTKVETVDGVDGTLDPQGTITLGEVATIIERILETAKLI